MSNRSLFVFILLLLLIALLLGGCGRRGEDRPAPVVQTEEPPLVRTIPPDVAPETPAEPGLAPAKARPYQAVLTRNARVVWGMDAPLAMLGAQVEQESGWNEKARSAVGAQGLGQFMPATADWIDGAYPDLGPAQPFNPAWALRALVQYDLHLYKRMTGATDCDRFAFALSSYNGGEKWVSRDKIAAQTAGRDPSRYWGEVETFNGGRNAAAWTENRGYPKRIIVILQPKYVTWGKAVCK